MRKEDLRPCFRLYFQEEIDGINPISEIDAEILVAINQCLLNQASSAQIVEILKSYKRVDDKAILNRLLQIVDDISEDADFAFDDEEGDAKSASAVDLGGNIVFLSLVFSIEKVEIYNSKLKEMEYGLLFNKSDATRTNDVYANKTLIFTTRSARDVFFKKIKDYLIESRGINFL